jgi:proteasome accessory factor A
VLEALVQDPDRDFPRLADPLAALPSISRDPAFHWELLLDNGTLSTAIAVQTAYLAAVRDVCDLSSPEKMQVLADWEMVLNDLEADYSRCSDRLDWVAKLGLIREFQSRQSVKDDDPWLRSIDLEYHRLDMSEGLYYGLEQARQMQGVPEEGLVRDAVKNPPFTRAYVRGKCIQKFAAAVISAQWDHITLQGSDGPIKISLLDLFAPNEILHYARTIDAARTPDDLRMIANVPI